MTYHYDYRNGRVTLNWLSPTGLAGKFYRLMCKIGLNWAVGLTRIHDNENNIPGPYNCVVIVFVIGKKYELMGFCGDRPTKAEFRHFYSYLNSLGLRRTYRRAKTGQKMYEIA